MIIISRINLRLVIFDKKVNRTGDIWHVFIEGGPGFTYGWRVDGPYEPYKGFRFNRNKLLLDPYAKVLSENLIQMSRFMDTKK